MDTKPRRGIEIVPYEPRYREEILAFLARWSPDHPELADPKVFDWQRCERYLAIFQGRIVGHIAHIPQVFCFGNREVQLGLAATLVLDISVPLVQTFAGTALLDRLTGDRNFTFAAVGVVPEIENTHRRRGFVVQRQAVRMYARFLRPAPVLRYLGKHAILATPMRLANALRRGAASPDAGTVESITDFPPEWDPIWRRHLSDRGEAHGVRTAEFLNEKLRQPNKSYAVQIHRDHHGSVDGYLIYREAVHNVRNLRIAKIVDLVGADAACGALLGRAMTWAAQAGADSVVALDSVLKQALYRRCGLWIARPYPVVLPPELDGPIRISFLDSDLDHLW